MMKALLLLVSVLSSLTFAWRQEEKLSNIDQILQQGIGNRVYPGVVAMAGTKSGKILYSNAFGNHEYLDEHPASPSITHDSIFDLASVTKVLATTSAIALLYQQGHLTLTDRISDLLDDHRYADHGNKENITVLHCLLHNAGYQADPVPGYYEEAFNCSHHFETEELSCLSKIYNSLLYENITTTNPGESYVYSDLSFITLQYVVGSIVFAKKLQSVKNIRSECFQEIHRINSMNQLDLNRGLIYTCYFEAFVRKEIFQEDRKWLPRTGYLPHFAFEDQNLTVPTMDTSYTKEVRQGNVSDSNCYAMGGICGHAGVFSVADDLHKLLVRFLTLTSATLQDPIEPYHNWLNATTMKLFTAEYNSSQSSRAFGWTTNDPSVTDFGYSQSCGDMSMQTFMHIGYTGTCICVDPVHQIWSLILTNREYEFGSSDAVKGIYRDFNNAILSLSLQLSADKAFH